MLTELRRRSGTRLEFLGCPVDSCTMSEVIGLATAAMRQRKRLQHTDLNVAKCVSMRTDARLRQCALESDIVCIDGMGILWGCRLIGMPVRERVTGIDLMNRVIEVCAQQGFRPYFLGARKDVLDTAIAEVRRKHPDIQIAGWRNGYFRPEEEREIVADIRASRADCLFVGISSPIKEIFLNRYRDELDVPVQLGVGGSFDVLAGRVRRAPIWMQHAGLEWLFRLAQEPHRLFWRYLLSNAQYGAILAVVLARRLASAAIARAG